MCVFNDPETGKNKKGEKALAFPVSYSSASINRVRFKGFDLRPKPPLRKGILYYALA
jgi:hypothetical protein